MPPLLPYAAASTLRYGYTLPLSAWDVRYRYSVWRYGMCGYGGTRGVGVWRYGMRGTEIVYGAMGCLVLI
eukprot:586232-Rhodomonas_salina.1